MVASHQGGDQALARGRHPPDSGAGNKQPRPASVGVLVGACSALPGQRSTRPLWKICRRPSTPPPSRSGHASSSALPPLVSAPPCQSSRTKHGQPGLLVCVFGLWGTCLCTEMCMRLTTNVKAEVLCFCKCVRWGDVVAQVQASTVRATRPRSARPAAAGATTWPRSAASGRPRRSRPRRAAPSSCAQVLI